VKEESEGPDSAERRALKICGRGRGKRGPVIESFPEKKGGKNDRIKSKMPTYREEEKGED